MYLILFYLDVDCRLCSRGFMSRRQLGRHFNEVHGDLLECGVCRFELPSTSKFLWFNIQRGSTLASPLDIMSVGKINSVTYLPLRSVFQIVESGFSLHAVHPENLFLSLHAGIIIEFHPLTTTRLIRHQLYLYQHPSLHFKIVVLLTSFLH